MGSHQCADCDHKWFDPGQSEDSVSPAVQCPNCHSYRTQPSGIPDEANEMLHGLQAMPDSSQDDMSGNPLQEGFMGDYKNRSVRDESFASSYRPLSLFETPEFETTELTLPPDLYRHALATEAAHRASVQIPKGITDNLHATLGNLQAWVENPYENGQLRPYYNKYWQVIRPSFMKPGAIQIGVADPTMAEIINHVAQTDDPTPLYEYRGKQSHVKTAGPLVALLPEAGAALAGGEAAGAGAAAAGSAAEAAGAAGSELAGAGAADAAGAAAGNAAADAGGGAVGDVAAGDVAGAGGVGGLMKRVAPSLGQGALRQVGWQGMGMLDDALGMGGGGAIGGQGGGSMPIEDSSYYARIASDEDDAHPGVHDEIPKQEDGDYKQQDDGNHHEWQRDISVNDMGGTEHSPSFQHGGPGLERLMMMAPLLMQYLQSGEDGSEDPMIKGLHDTLESEVPGYLDHAHDGAADQLIMMLAPKKAEPEKNEPDHMDENSGGKHESKVVKLKGIGLDFLPNLTPVPPSLRGAAMYPQHPQSELAEGVIGGPIYPEEEMLDSGSWPKSREEYCPHCGAYTRTALGLCPQCGEEVYPSGQAQQMAYSKTADTQGPTTPEQIQAVQQYLLEHGSELGLEGQELLDTILSVPTNPLDFADILAQIAQREGPPSPPQGAPPPPPQPAQENAPPGATMPVPGMDGPSAQSMMSAVRRYAADSVADKCPVCEGHTTALLDENDGTSKCHSCGHVFKTKGVIPKSVDNGTVSSWRVAGDDDQMEPVQGVPIADQTKQRDLREEQDSGHTWLDEEGNPLKVGQEYEMYSDKYDIPDLVRIEAVKPTSIVYTLTGEYGLGHSTELTKEEANIERISFQSTNNEGELGTDDSLENNNDDNTAYRGEPEQRDLSAPSGLVSASVIESGVDYENPNLAWLMNGVHTAGANYTPMEQRALIDEPGVARNISAMNLVGTHYVEDADDDQFLFGI